MNIKGIISAVLALLICAFPFCSCSKSGEDLSPEQSDGAENVSGTVSGETSAETSADIPERLYASDIKDFSPYVSLGRYKGVEIVKKEVTDEIIEQNRLEIMDSVKELRDIGTERAAAMGDNVIMDYKGFRKDTGEAFEGGTAENAELVLGSGQFIEGFEEGIVGHKAGETFDINLSFPKEYHDSALAGQPVRFEIKLKTVKEIVCPELTDEIAKKLNYESASELLSDAEAKAKEFVYLENIQAAWQQAVKNAEIKSFPQELFDNVVSGFVEYEFQRYNYIASAYYGVELEELTNMTEEEFRAELTKKGKDYTESYLTEEMIMYSIADAEFGREISEDEYKAKIREYADKAGVSEEELKEKNSEKDLVSNMVWDKVLVFVYENAHISEK